MHPATKSIATAVADFRERVAVDFTDSEDMTRQEYKEEADINTILHRFAVTGVAPPTRTPVYGDRDFDIDLHAGYIAMADAQRAFLKLPKLLREHYGTYLKMLDAVHDGSFKQLLIDAVDELDARRAAAPPAPPTEPE